MALASAANARDAAHRYVGVPLQVQVRGLGVEYVTYTCTLLQVWGGDKGAEGEQLLLLEGSVLRASRRRLR